MKHTWNGWPVGVSVTKLRAINPNDKEMIRQWSNSPEVNRYVFKVHQINFSEYERWFNQVLKNVMTAIGLLSVTMRQLACRSLCYR